MTAHDRRKPTRREFLPESLERRVALSAFAAHHPVAEVAHARPHAHHHTAAVTLTARVHGQFAQPVLLPGQDAIATGTASGTSHRFGPLLYATEYTAHGEDQYTFTTTINTGGATLSSSTLGHIQIAYYGSESGINPGYGRLSLSGTATALTGPYAGDTGTFRAHGAFEGASGKFDLVMTITLAPPHKTTTMTP